MLMVCKNCLLLTDSPTDTSKTSLFLHFHSLCLMFTFVFQGIAILWANLLFWCSLQFPTLTWEWGRRGSVSIYSTHHILVLCSWKHPKIIKPWCMKLIIVEWWVGEPKTGHMIRCIINEYKHENIKVGV